MRHFIPDLKDRMYFENFLQQYGIDLISENVKSKQNFTENNGVSGEILTNGKNEITVLFFCVG